MKRIISMTVLALLTISAMAQTSKAELLAHMELAITVTIRIPQAT